MMSDSNGNNNASSIKKDGDDYHSLSVMESVVKVTLAGFGGALAGMSLSRVGGAGRNAIAAQMRRKQMQQQSNLPMTWAIGCMTFVGVLEVSRVTSPTSQLLTLFGLDTKNNAYASTIGDFTLGGLVAGAALRGNMRPTAAPLSLGARLCAGMALGLAAGVGQCGLDFLDKQIHVSAESLSPDEVKGDS